MNNENRPSFIPKNINQGFRRQTWFTCVAYLTYFLFGIMRGYPSFLLEQLESTGSLIPIKSSSEISWLASLSIFPNPFGSILAGFLMDKNGRKITIQLSMLIFTAGWAVITCSQNLFTLCTGNVIVGVAIGMGSCSTIYVAEICEVRNRCMLLSVLEVFFSLGILVAYVLTSYLKWNTAALIFTIFSIFSLYLLHWIPESPYWLIQKNRMNEAMECFKKLRCQHEEEKNNLEFKSLSLSLEKEQHMKGILTAIKENIKRLFILILFHVLLQGTGYTILLTYQTIFLSKFVINLDHKVVGIGYSVSSFIASFLTPFSVNYWRRKEVTIISGIGMTISLASLAFCNIYSQNHSSVVMWYVIPGFLYLYLCSCTVGVLTLSQVMIGELYPTDVRGTMCGFTEAVGTILSGFSVKLYPFASEYFDQNEILFFFAIFGILTVVYGKFILPETYGKSLTNIQNYFSKENEVTESSIDC